MLSKRGIKMKTNEIKIDWDSCWVEFKKLFVKRYSLLFSYKKLELQTINMVYKTKHGYHIYLYSVKDYNRKDILLFEAILGDDLNRTAYNYLENVDVLFHNKHNSHIAKRQLVKTLSLEFLIVNIEKKTKRKKIIRGEFK